MRSSTSSSDLRTIPDGRWGRTLLAAFIVFVVALGSWEVYWRAEWFRPSTRNSDGLWAMTRDRIDNEDGRGVAIIGSSRVLFDVNPETWREETGTLPIQLALEGTNPRPYLRHLAQETRFAGLLLVGVTEVLFFGPEGGERGAVLQWYRDRSPADRASHQLSMRVVEPVFAYYDPDTALFTVVRRQPFWPLRQDLVPAFPVVRKLSNSRRTRHAEMWDKVERHPEYREIARNTWLTMLNTPPPGQPTPEQMQQQMDKLLREVADDVRTIRARGGDVVFVRCPSTGPFWEFERKIFPRAHTWDVLLTSADAAGVHFLDHHDLRDVELPEWSHILAADTPKFTRALVRHVREALAARGTTRQEMGK